MNTLKHTLRTNPVLKNPDDNIHHGDRAIKLVLAAMICLGVVALPALADTNDQPKVTTSAIAKAYQIPSGMLRDVLKRFAKQAGITLYFKGVNLQGVTTQGLSGSHTTKDGLDRLLAEAGLYAVPKGNGYLIQKISPAVVASNPTPNLAPIESQVVVPVVSSAKPIEKETALPVASKPIEKETALPVASMPSPSPSLVEKEAVLPTVSVSATSAKNADGYTVKRISSATKTDTLLRDIPQSVSVVTQDMIQDQSMKSMAEVVRYVPGVGMSQGEGNNDSPIFRGNQSSADFYVDGIRDDVQYFRDLYNMERVDVLKGPSGMIFGRGSSGGIINRVTKEADWNPVREVTLQGGSFNTKRVMLDVGQGVNEVVAVRLNAMYENSGSYRDDVTVKRQGISPTVTILPDARTKIVVGAEVFQDSRVVDRGVPSYNGLPLSTSRSTVFGNPALSPAETDVKSLNSLVEHEFDDKLVVRNRNRLAVYDKSYQNIYAVGP
ncbi:MAG: TonB-dependent receptor plug domain-containing protein, partial [Proteobacteria bacterium]|nr:TonB-dependent receptor plug domain-containing protein [Pseudomonadota bacterium]